jgi:IS5 family transposase
MGGKQLGFGDYEQTTARKRTKRERFLAQMEAVVPWKALIDLIEPQYPKAGSKGGRPAYPLETMLRIHLMQQWYDLSDPAMEDALIEVPTMRRFAGINLISDRIPDETTILSFRHLSEKHDLGKQIFETVKRHLKANGMAMKQGTIIDATLIAAPSSTKNEKKERDPEMHQTKKGNQWYFGMKVHIGVDSESGLIHSVETTAANVHDLTPAAELLHREQQVVYRDDLIETIKAHIRTKVAHPFRIIKRQSGFQSTQLRGILLPRPQAERGGATRTAARSTCLQRLRTCSWLDICCYVRRDYRRRVPTVFKLPRK